MSTILDLVRQKYPEYAQVGDEELVSRIGTKYPQYLEHDPVFKAEYLGVQQKRIASIGPAMLQDPGLAAASAAGQRQQTVAPTGPAVPFGSGVLPQGVLPGGMMAWTPPSGYYSNVPLDVSKPFVPIPSATGTTPLGKVAAGLYNVAKGIPETIESPLGVLTAPLAGAGALGRAILGGTFGGLSAKAGGQQLGEASVTGDLQQAVEGGAGLAMAPFVALGGMERPAPTPEPTPLSRPFAKAPEFSMADLNAAIRDVAESIQRVPSSSRVEVPPAPPTPPAGVGVPPRTLAPAPATVAKPSVPTEGLRPAVRTMDGKVVLGTVGEAHDDIINREKIPATNIDRRGFLDAQGNWVDREQGPDSGQPVPGLHAQGPGGLAERVQTMLAEPGPVSFETAAAITAKGGETIDTQGQGRLPSGEPPDREKLRDVQVQGGGTTPSAPVEAVPTSLRAEVEREIPPEGVLHRLYNVASLIGRQPAEQRGALRDEAKQIEAAVKAGTADMTDVEAFRQKLTGTPAKVETPVPQSPIGRGATVPEPFPQQGLYEGTAEWQQRVAEWRKRNPTLGLPPTGNLELSGPTMVRQEFRGEGEFDGTQIVNRLRNKLTPGEWEVYKAAGIEQFAGKKVRAEDVAAWMQDKGPRVEVRMKGGTRQLPKGNTPEMEENMRLVHELDTRLPGWRGMASNQVPAEFRDLYNRQYQLSQIVEEQFRTTPPEMIESPQWAAIAPKENMPGYVEGAVTTPSPKITSYEDYIKSRGMFRSEQTRRAFEESVRKGQNTSDVLFHSSHSFPPNTLGFFRGYMETRPDGGKTFHVIEVQSDWAASAKKDLEVYRRMNPESAASLGGHPLLRDWERLTLKAAIEHAVKEGADRIAVSDAPTAMMSEGHDRAAMMETPHAPSTIEALGLRPKISQEPGMRLHYDTILPRLLAELTGSEGKRVDFGPHKMAFELRGVSVEEGRAYGHTEEPTPRKDLIFQEGGRPKTSVTATEFPLGKVQARQEPFPLFGKGRTLGMPPAPRSVQDLYTTLPEGDKRAFDAMQLGKVDNLGDVVTNLAKSEDTVGRTWAGLAGFLDRHFGHVLRVQGVDLGEARPGEAGAAYMPGAAKAFLNLEDTSLPLPVKILEEAAHAATYWQFNFPKNDVEFKAAQLIRQLRTEGQEKGLTPPEARFLKEVFAPAMERRVQVGTEPQDFWNKLDAAGIGRSRVDMLYRLNSDDEFLAGLFSDGRFRRFLNTWEHADRNGLYAFVDSVKQLLGVKADKALDAAFDALINVAESGSDSWELADELRAMRGLGTAPTPPSQIVRDVTSKEKLRKVGAYASGWSLPSHVAVSEDLANKAVSYGSSHLINEYVPPALVTRVLEGRNDINFRRSLGAVISQMRFDALRDDLTRQAANEPDPAKRADLEARASQVTNVWDTRDPQFRSREDYNRIRTHPEMQAAIERHVDIVQPVAEQAHVGVGGKLGIADPETGAFINMKALLNTEDEGAVRAAVYGARQGDITSGLRRGTRFGREFKGTGQAYEWDYRKLAERSLRGNTEQYALRQYIDSLKDAGVAVEAKVGQQVGPTIKGRQPLMRTIELRGGGPGMTRDIKLWVHPDLAREFDGLRKTESVPQKGAVGMLIDLGNTLQVFGVTDGIYHTSNMIAAIATAEGSGPGKLGVLGDLVRKGLPPVGVLDAFGRIVVNTTRIVMDTPAVQQELAQIALAGAARGKQVHRGAVGRVIGKLGGPEWMDLNFWTGKAINALDKAGRVTLNQMYDNMVERTWAKDSVLDRREFINKMGQYNKRVMSQVASWLRETGLGPFVVAGKNFNRLAAQRLIMSPGVRAASPQGFAKMRLVESISTITALATIPAIINYVRTGSPFGRPGVRPGQIDLGTDDKYGRPNVFDPQKENLLRRGMSVTGLSAIDRARGMHLGTADTVKEITKDVFQAAMRPMVGPGLRAIATFATGREPLTGRPVSKNPFDMGENIRASLEQLNPMLASAFGATENIPGGVKGPIKQVGEAVGFTVGRFPSFEERMATEVAKLGHQPSAQERIALTKEVRAAMAETPQETQAARAGSEKRLWHDIAQQDALRGRLTPEHQGFLDKYGLRLPGFAEEITAQKVRVPLSKDEAAKMATTFAREYDSAIELLVTDKDFPKESHARQQVRLDRVLTQARKRARRESRSLLAPVPVGPSE